ncbi:hypothetical protein ACJX0J_012631 [Zea mays]
MIEIEKYFLLIKIQCPAWYRGFNPQFTMEKEIWKKLQNDNSTPEVFIAACICFNTMFILQTYAPLIYKKCLYDLCHISYIDLSRLFLPIFQGYENRTCHKMLEFSTNYFLKHVFVNGIHGNFSFDACMFIVTQHDPLSLENVSRGFSHLILKILSHLILIRLILIHLILNRLILSEALLGGFFFFKDFLGYFFFSEEVRVSCFFEETESLVVFFRLILKFFPFFEDGINSLAVRGFSRLILKCINSRKDLFLVFFEDVRLILKVFFLVVRLVGLIFSFFQRGGFYRFFSFFEDIRLILNRWFLVVQLVGLIFPFSKEVCSGFFESLVGFFFRSFGIITCLIVDVILLPIYILHHITWLLL